MMSNDPLCPYEGFLQFRNQSNEMQTLVKFFSEKSTEIDLSSVRSMISIGAGDGVMDLHLISKCFAGLKSYIGIENDRENFSHLQQTFNTPEKPVKNSSGATIDVRLVPDNAASFSGPEHRVDMISMMHVLYYFKGGKEAELIQQALTWLNPDGLLIIGIVAENNFMQRLANIRKRELVPWPEKIKSKLKALGLNWTEYSIKHEFQPEACDKRFVDFVLHKKSSQLEQTDVFKLMNEMKDPTSGLIPHETTVLVVKNPCQL